jgi:hypothetical protein
VKVFLVASAVSFAVLPILIIVNVLFNRERTHIWMLWLQSSLAGLWLFCGCVVIWSDRFGESVLWPALLAGILVAATPIVPAWQRFRRDH